MTKRIGNYLAVLVVMILIHFSLAGCSSDSDQMMVEMSASGTTVTLEQGQELVVRLESNPTTGYGWTVAAVNTAVLQQIGDIAYEPVETELVGSGGWESCRFGTLEAGETTLEMVYRRPWEENSAPENSFTLNVIVR